MKKLLFLLSGLAVAATASAGVYGSLEKKIANYQDNQSKVVYATRANGLVPASIPAKSYGWGKMSSRVLKTANALTWDFEDAAQFDEFMVVDNDGDGYNWEYHTNAGLSEGLMNAHSGDGIVMSASYDNDTGTELSPDNWLVSPEVTLGGVLSFWAVGQDANYCDEKFAVYVCVGTPTDVDDFVMVTSDYTATDAYVLYEVDLSAYQGQVGHFAIVHHNVYDQFVLNVDDITLDAGAVILPYPVVPENLTVTPAATTADVAWDNDPGAENWNLRYRPFTSGAESGFSITLPYPGYETEIADVSILDADGDGNVWGLAYSDNTQTDLCFYSDSWSSATYEALTPDNWLIMPLLELDGVIEFSMWHRSTYSEKMEVMIGPEDAVADSTVYTDRFTTIASFTTEDNSPVDYSIDISSYAGQMGYVVFRHYGTTDQWRLYLDNIFIGKHGPEPAPWVYVNELTEPNYTITGLTPETEYEVQVMGYNASHESDWCDIVNFTTLADAPSFLRGDVDNNGEVKIADVTALINYLLSGDASAINLLAADCDENGEVKIADVTTLINYLLSGSW